MSEVLQLDGRALTIAEVALVARTGLPVVITSAALQQIEASRRVVSNVLDRGQTAYGVNTGFGNLSRVRIPPEQVLELQRNLIRSHAAGVGPPLEPDVTRAIMLLLAASLTRGLSGVRPVIAQWLVDALNKDLQPVVPSRGSVGASGDLAPLAHLALTMIGEGEVRYLNDIRPAGEVLPQLRLSPLALEAKEGLALINGTHAMTAIGALALADLRCLLDASYLAAAMSLDAARATDACLDPRIQSARNQPGQIEVAERLRGLLTGSTILPSHKTDDPRVQDPYSFRCIPQVLGAVLDALGFVASVIERELGAVTDNPLCFPEDGDIVSGGNFHGQPVALALDMLALALTHLASISERRAYHLISATDSENPVPMFLSPQPGIHNGLMIAQYTAAALCNENQVLAHPASAANIPTSAGMEDFNSMGMTAALKLRQVLDNTTRVVAIELLCAAEGLEYQRPLRSGDQVEGAHARIRQTVPRLEADRPLAPDIEAIAQMIRAGTLRVERQAGKSI